ncbi:flagellar basal-body MS-ring/collar protein FliF [Nitrospira sp. Kam-Ns4a]
MLAKFAALPMARRLTIVIGLAAAVAALVAVALWSQQPELQVLFSGLSPDDAGAIIEKLKEAKIPYEVGAGGGSILVEAARVHELRLQLASQGLPHGGGVGFEIFDRNTIGMSEFVQKLNYRRALQGELARTIAQLPEVERARVHLAVPERRLFSSEQERPRASVVLSLRRGASLSKAQTQGIVHLVASSVEGLQPGAVTVVDGHGRLLSEAADDGPTRLSGSQLEYQRSLEKDIEQRIQTMLERIVGAGKAVVRVSSVLDFRQVELTEERFDPNGQVVRSEQRQSEKTSGSATNSGPAPAPAAGGPPGVASNVPGAGAPAEAEGPVQASSQSSQTKHETVNYEISRTVSRIVEPVGTIKQLSVAVLVDGTYEMPKEGNQAGGKRIYIPRSEADMKQIEEIVKMAMGFSAERRDQVEVVNIPFDVEAEEGPGATAEAGVSALTAAAPYVRYGVAVLLFVLILLIVVRPLIATLTAAPAAPTAGSRALPQELPMTVSEVEASLSAAPRAQLVDQAQRNPETTALVIRQWLRGGA